MADPALHEVLSALAAGLSALETGHGARLALLHAADHLILGEAEAAG